jgi:hypothetical protein
MKNSFYWTILHFREEHTQRKIDKLIVDAKAKMAKNDKKGKSEGNQEIKRVHVPAVLCQGTVQPIDRIWYLNQLSPLLSLS